MGIKQYSIIAGILSILFLVNNYVQNIRENRILENNQAAYKKELFNIRNSLVEYVFEDKKDLQDYLINTDNALKGLMSKIEDNGIKIKNIRSIISTDIKTKDTIINTIILDSIYEKLLNKDNFKVPIEYSSTCFYIKAELEFKDGTSVFRSLEERYNDTLSYVSADYKKPHRWLFGIKSSFLSKKIYKISLFNSCGDVKTITIDGPSKNKKINLE